MILWKLFSPYLCEHCRLKLSWRHKKYSSNSYMGHQNLSHCMHSFRNILRRLFRMSLIIVESKSSSAFDKSLFDEGVELVALQLEGKSLGNIMPALKKRWAIEGAVACAEFYSNNLQIAVMHVLTIVSQVLSSYRNLLLDRPRCRAVVDCQENAKKRLLLFNETIKKLGGTLPPFSAFFHFLSCMGCNLRVVHNHSRNIHIRPHYQISPICPLIFAISC